MNKKKILDLVEKDFDTIANLERSMAFMLSRNSCRKGLQYQHKVLHAAFRRTCDILLKRRKEIARELGLKLLTLHDPPGPKYPKLPPTRKYWPQQPKSLI